MPQLLTLANSMELERDHALDRPDTGDEDPELLLAAAQREESGSDTVGPDGLVGTFQALDAQATFDRVLFDGGEFGTGAEVGSDEELDFLGLPGLLEPDQVSLLLRQRQADQVSARAGRHVPAVDHRRLTELRKELNTLVGAWSRRSGQPHGSVHAELRRRSGGPEVALATAEQLAARTVVVRGWFVGKR